MTRKLERRVALITGAAQGAGRGAALAFARAGAACVLVGRRETPLRELERELMARGARVHVVAADVGVLGEIQRCVAETIERFDQVDVLVNAAQSPSMREASLLEVTAAEIDQLWQTGVVATLEMMRACHPYMKGRGGSIINFGSGAQFAPTNHGVYAAAKAGINMITRAAAVEWAADGIRANLVVPLVVSPAYEEAIARTPGIEAHLAATIPLGRMGDPEHDVGNALVFLASDDARYVTGTTLMLDGGQAFLR